MDFGNIHLEIAKQIGQPINASLPVPMEIAAIANVGTAEAGEKVYVFEDLDTEVDYVLDVDVNGKITTKKVSPIGDVQLSFKGLQTKLEYVLVDVMLNAVDQDVLIRRKRALTRSLDKLESRMILTAITTGANPALAGADAYVTDPASLIQEVDVASGEDLYDVIVKAKHALEDYGDGFVLLAGVTIKEKIDTYDKEKAGTHNYKVGLREFLANAGITVVKIFGKVKYNAEVAAERLLDANKFVLIATNSRLAEGKPISFIRRKIAPEMAKLMGADVDTAQRANFVIPTPVQTPVTSGDDRTNTVAFGVFAYESVIWAITNPYAIVRSADLDTKI